MENLQTLAVEYLRRIGIAVETHDLSYGTIISALDKNMALLNEAMRVIRP